MGRLSRRGRFRAPLQQRKFRQHRGRSRRRRHSRGGHRTMRHRAAPERHCWTGGPARRRVSFQRASLNCSVIHNFTLSLVAGCAEVTSRLGWQEPVAEMESLYAKLTRPTKFHYARHGRGSSLCPPFLPTAPGDVSRHLAHREYLADRFLVVPRLCGRLGIFRAPLLEGIFRRGRSQRSHAGRKNRRHPQLDALRSAPSAWPLTPTILPSAIPRSRSIIASCSAVCGTATNAFLNLSRSAGLHARRLLLLSPQHFANHVVAEVLVDGRWIIVDPTFRLILRDAQGHTLTRQELRDPVSLRPGHRTYPQLSARTTITCWSAHVRVARLPMDRFRSAYRSAAHLSRLGRKRATGACCSSANRSFSSLLPLSFSVFLCSSLCCWPGTPTIVCAFLVSTCAIISPAPARVFFPLRRLKSSVCGICGVAFAAPDQHAQSRVRAMAAAMRPPRARRRRISFRRTARPGPGSGHAPPQHHRSSRRQSAHLE